MCCKVLWTKINPFFLAFLIGLLSSDFFVPNKSLPIIVSDKATVQNKSFPSEVKPVLNLNPETKKCVPVDPNLNYCYLETEENKTGAIEKPKASGKNNKEKTKLNKRKNKADLQKRFEELEKHLESVPRIGVTNLLHLEKCSDL